MAAVMAQSLPSCSAKEQRVYKSTLDRAGAVYKPLHTVCLGTIAAERV